MNEKLRALNNSSIKPPLFSCLYIDKHNIQIMLLKSECFLGFHMFNAKGYYEAKTCQ